MKSVQNGRGTGPRSKSGTWLRTNPNAPRPRLPRPPLHRPPPGPDQPFIFEVNGCRTHFGNAQLLDQLRRFGATVANRPFKVRDFNAWPQRICGANTIARRFGSWRTALTQAGIMGAKPASYTAEELIQILERVWRDMGRAPGVHSLRRWANIGPSPYIRRWGSLRNASKLLARFHRAEISRDELLGAGPHRPRRRASIPPQLRWTILARDGHKCLTCGRQSPAVTLEIDHITPVCAGGTDDPANLRTLCRSCNRGKGGNHTKPGDAAAGCARRVRMT